MMWRCPPAVRPCSGGRQSSTARPGRLSELSSRPTSPGALTAVLESRAQEAGAAFFLVGHFGSGQLPPPRRPAGEHRRGRQRQPAGAGPHPRPLPHPRPVATSSSWPPRIGCASSWSWNGSSGPPASPPPRPSTTVLRRSGCGAGRRRPGLVVPRSGRGHLPHPAGRRCRSSSAGPSRLWSGGRCCRRGSGDGPPRRRSHPAGGRRRLPHARRRRCWRCTTGSRSSSWTPCGSTSGAGSGNLSPWLCPGGRCGRRWRSPRSHPHQGNVGRPVAGRAILAAVDDWPR